MKSVTHEKLPGYDSIGSELLQDHPQLVKEMASQCRTRFFYCILHLLASKKYITSPLQHHHYTPSYIHVTSTYCNILFIIIYILT